jgi:hypothetical protein
LNSGIWAAAIDVMIASATVSSSDRKVDVAQWKFEIIVPVFLGISG